MSSDAPVGLLQHRPFVQFWIARVATTIAMQMQAVAVGWQIYDLTGSALDLGLVGLAQFIPALLLLLVAGHFADRHDRRMIVAAAQAVEGLAVATLALGTFGGWMTPRLILGTLSGIGAAPAFRRPALCALVARPLSPSAPLR